ncbi:MAG: 50S ribosomal protein L4 [Saprospiraceae bacterium]|jgi:large subunit ribosomal protein L4|nr:50S ribosomal protein L4 [Saprospiraceae bacterium]
MKIEVLNKEGQQTGRSVELPDDIFGIEPNEHVVYLAVKQYLANQRQGTHKAKERSEMTGSTRKLHRQKGTGGSRKGDINSPLFHGGARVFGPRPRDYSQKLNKKVRRLARKSALSSKAANGQIFIVEDFTFEAPKTKSFMTMLNKLAVSDRKTLLVTAEHDPAVYLSGRNLQEASVVRAADLNTYEILKAQTLILAESALDKIKQSLA